MAISCDFAVSLLKLSCTECLTANQNVNGLIIIQAYSTIITSA